MSRESTKQIKGLAILLMLAHHLFAYPERMPFDAQLSTGIVLSGIELTVIIGKFCKICVSFFMFLGGFGLYYSTIKQADDSKNMRSASLSKRLIKLFAQYWKVFALFIPIAFLLFGKYPQWANTDYHARYSEFHFYELIKNFLGLSYSYNEEWWFLKVYVFSLFLGNVFLEINKTHKGIYLELLQILLWYLLCSFIFPAIGRIESVTELEKDFWYKNIFCLDNYSVLFLGGIVYAKYEIFQKWKEEFKIKNSISVLVVSIAVLLLFVYLRVFLVQGNQADLLFVPTMIFSYLTLSEKFVFIEKPLQFLGEYSTNIWLCHSFFCYYFYPFVKIICISKNGFIAYATLLFLSLIAAIAIEKFWKTVKRLCKNAF